MAQRDLDVVEAAIALGYIPPESERGDQTIFHLNQFQMCEIQDWLHRRDAIDEHQLDKIEYGLSS